jgi:polyisoprenoid-binding protein YceI
VAYSIAMVAIVSNVSIRMLDSFKPRGQTATILVIVTYLEAMVIAPYVVIAASLQQSRPVTSPTRLHEYTVDAGHSPVDFSIGFGLTHVKGRLTRWRGTILYDSVAPPNSSISAIFETKSLDTGWGNRDRHLRTSDFFDVERFPTITFESDRLRPVGNSWVAEGSLTMRGSAKTVAIPFRFVTRAPTRDGQSGPMKLHVAGSVRLARADFGVLGGSTYNSWFDRARAATMADSVDITFEVESWRTDAANVRPEPVDAALRRVTAAGVGAQVQRVRARRDTTDSSLWESIAFGQTFVTLALVLSGKSSEAVTFARSLIDLFPRSPTASLALGFASETAGDRRTAAQAYRRAKEVYAPPKPDPNEPFPQDDSNWYYADAFIRILLEGGTPAQAVVDFARVVAELWPNVGRAHSRYGEVLALEGRRAEADEAFTRALQLDPMDARAMAYRRALLR